jgi:hypothetical protein
VSNPSLAHLRSLANVVAEMFSMHCNSDPIRP